MVYDYATISEQAEISGKARVFRNARIFGVAKIRDYASICGYAEIGGQSIIGTECMWDYELERLAMNKKVAASMPKWKRLCHGCVHLGHCDEIGGIWCSRNIIYIPGETKNFKCEYFEQYVGKSKHETKG